MDPQFIAVLLIVILAALYAGWRFLRQFHRPDDEAEGCANCPAARPDLFAGEPGGHSTSDEPPAPPSDVPPSAAPRV